MSLILDVSFFMTFFAALFLQVFLQGHMQELDPLTLNL